MAQRIRCHCSGDPACKLCTGSGTYEYEPGPRGWMPFRCPTCEGRWLLGDRKCPTCTGLGNVDPANPPMKGPLDIIWKAIFGA